ncbi:MAG: hypothetical protein ACREBR_01635, partial [bacterium]
MTVINSNDSDSCDDAHVESISVDSDTDEEEWVDSDNDTDLVSKGSRADDQDSSNDHDRLYDVIVVSDSETVQQCVDEEELINNELGPEAVGTPDDDNVEVSEYKDESLSSDAESTKYAPESENKEITSSICIECGDDSSARKLFLIIDSGARNKVEEWQSKKHPKFYPPENISGCSFRKCRKKLTQEFLHEFNVSVFSSLLHDKVVEVSWSPRLLTTAGLTRLKRQGGVGGSRTALIELSSK